MTTRHSLRLHSPVLLATMFVAGSLAAQVREVPPGAPDPIPRGPHLVTVERSVMVPMRDGVKLATDLYRPADTAGKFSTILMRSPYNKQGNAGIDNMYASQGYMVAVQDVRGKFATEGDFRIYQGDM